MENASKALIIAGGVLIGVLVVGLFVRLVTIFGSFSANINNKIATDQVVAYNKNFYQYQGKIDITADDIAGLINYARQCNEDRKLSNNSNDVNNKFFIHIQINGIMPSYDDYLRDLDTNTYNDNTAFKKALNKFISDNNTKLFMCDVSGFRISTSTDKQGRHYIENIQYKNGADFNTNSEGMVNKIVFTLATNSTSPSYDVLNKDLFINMDENQ